MSPLKSYPEKKISKENRKLNKFSATVKQLEQAVKGKKGSSKSIESKCWHLCFFFSHMSVYIYITCKYSGNYRRSDLTDLSTATDVTHYQIKKTTQMLPEAHILHDLLQKRLIGFVMPMWWIFRSQQTTNTSTYQTLTTTALMQHALQIIRKKKNLPLSFLNSHIPKCVILQICNKFRLLSCNKGCFCIHGLEARSGGAGRPKLLQSLLCNAPLDLATLLVSVKPLRHCSYARH